MYSAAIIWFKFLIGLVALPDVIASQPIVQIRKGQFFSRLKCPSIGNKVVCAFDKPAKAYNFSSREQCCANCNILGWSWFNFIDNEDQTMSAGGECQLFDQMPKRVAQKTRCSLYKSDSIQVNLTATMSICNAVIIMDRSSTVSSWKLPWSSYKNGFTLADGGYWLGLEQVHQLTSSASYRLLLEILSSGSWRNAQYQSFAIGDEANNQYKLTVSGYSGTAGDQLNWHNGLTFSILGYGAWWFGNPGFYCCFTCTPPEWQNGAATATAVRMTIIRNQ